MTLRSKLSKALLTVALPLAALTTSVTDVQAQQGRVYISRPSYGTNYHNTRSHIKERKVKDISQLRTGLLLDIGMNGRVGAGLSFAIDKDSEYWFDASAYFGRNPIASDENETVIETHEMDNKSIITTKNSKTNYMPTWKFGLTKKFGGFGVGAGIQTIGAQNEETVDEIVRYNSGAEFILSQDETQYSKTKTDKVIPYLKLSQDIGDRFSITGSVGLDVSGDLPATVDAGLIWKF